MEGKNFKELEDSIYSCLQECREEMKHHFFRFVELERKFQEITSKLIDLKIEMKINSPEPLNGERHGGKPTTAALKAEVSDNIGCAQCPQDTHNSKGCGKEVWIQGNNDGEPIRLGGCGIPDYDIKFKCGVNGNFCEDCSQNVQDTKNG